MACRNKQDYCTEIFIVAPDGECVITYSYCKEHFPNNELRTVMNYYGGVIREQS